MLFNLINNRRALTKHKERAFYRMAHHQTVPMQPDRVLIQARTGESFPPCLRHNELLNRRQTSMIWL
jgi:hypothetical protein